MFQILADDAIITQKTYLKEEDIMIEEELKEPVVLTKEEEPKSEELAVTGKLQIYIPYTI